MIADWTSSDRQVLSSIESDTSTIRDGAVNGFVNLFQGSSYGFGSWDSVYNYMTGGALNQKEKHSLTDFSMLSYLGMVAQSLGPLTYNYVNGEPVSSTWHSNRLSLYDALVGWDPTRNIESVNFTNGLLNAQKQVLDKMDVMTNQLSVLIQNQTNLLFLNARPYQTSTITMGDSSYDQFMADLQIGLNYTNQILSSPYWGMMFSLPNLTTDLNILTPAQRQQVKVAGESSGFRTFGGRNSLQRMEDFAKIYHSYYGNLRDPNAINPGTGDNADSWISDAKSFASTASENADEDDPVSTDDSWNATFANGYVEGALVGRLDAVSDETSGIIGPPRATFDVMRTTFNRVVDTEASGGFGFSFSVDFGNGASFQQTDTDIFEKAPAGFFENLRTRFTGYVTAWHNIVHVFLLVGLWLKTTKIVVSAFAGGDEV